MNLSAKPLVFKFLLEGFQEEARQAQGELHISEDASLIPELPKSTFKTLRPKESIYDREMDKVKQSPGLAVILIDPYVDNPPPQKSSYGNMDEDEDISEVYHDAPPP